MKIQALVFALALSGASFAQADDHGHAHDTTAATGTTGTATTETTTTETTTTATTAKNKKAAKKECAKMKDQAAKAKCMEETTKM